MTLIADSGSSKTAWVVLEGQEPVKSFQTVGINPYFWTSQQIETLLKSEVALKLQGWVIRQIFFYGAGCSSKEKKQVVYEALQQVFPNTQIFVEHDLLAAARALCGRAAGVACILGTGSNACVFDGEQIVAQPINLGFWLGDEGSGGYIGKALVKAFLHQEMPRVLQEKFQQKYSLTLSEVLENAYQKPFPNRYFASFAPFASENLEDDFIRALLYKSFEAFFDKYVAKLPSVEILPIHFVGSIAVVFKKILQEFLCKRQWQFGKVLQTPIEELVSYHAANVYQSP